MKELPVGTLIKVVEGDYCYSCVFKNSGICNKILCDFPSRSDGKAVKFIVVEQSAYEYDSNLRTVQVGDYIWYQVVGKWLKVKKILPQEDYPIYLENGDIRSTVTFDGKYDKNWAEPVAFIHPPIGFNAGPRPKNESRKTFKKGDEVIVWGYKKKKYNRVYSHYDYIKGCHVVYALGQNKWTSNGEYEYYQYCEKKEK